MTNFDAIFHALSDGTRRAVVARLAQGPASVTELAAPHDLALPTFLKHLKVLEASDLIETRKSGRTRTCTLVPGAAREAEDWLVQNRLLWEARLGRLDAFLAGTNNEGPADEPT